MSWRARIGLAMAALAIGGGFAWTWHRFAKAESHLRSLCDSQYATTLALQANIEGVGSKVDTTAADTEVALSIAQDNGQTLRSVRDALDGVRKVVKSHVAEIAEMQARLVAADASGVAIARLERMVFDLQRELESVSLRLLSAEAAKRR